ncbi:protein FAM43A [Emys orbicularis]|uniref:protein FAM43A n=1 Tax=Emys orbicularis TaxID=82168 RepID=UPI0031FE408C
MLPWRRNKFELLAEEPRQPSKPKGYAVRLHCSALGSLARACPEGALHRVGSMFRSKRRKFRVTSEDPTYTVLYLGNAATLQAKGEGCTDLAVGKIWAKSEAGRQGAKMKLTVGAQGIRMAHAEERGPRRPGHLYLLHRVTYCVADPRLPRVFAWIYRHELKHKAVMLRCHAVLVSRPEKARAMALLLYQTSAAALAEFRRLKKRDDARHQQQQLVGEQSIPLVPLRKLLPGRSCYKPPVERSRSAPKLGSITEDLLGEAQEERARPFECEDILEAPGGAPLLLRAGPGRLEGPELTQLISDLGELSIGNDLQALRADLRVTRLLSGESTGSESSIESSGQEGGAAPCNGQEEGGGQEPETG